MHLKIFLPTKVLIDQRVKKIIAEAENGLFCLEPRHVDFVTSLVPGLLTYVTNEDNEVFVGVDEGVLVKCGRTVRISTHNAVAGIDPEKLRHAVLNRSGAIDKHERSARSALARLEAGVAKRFIDLQRGL